MLRALVPKARILFVVALSVACTSIGPATASNTERNVCEGTNDYQMLGDCRRIDGDLVLESLDATQLHELEALRRVDGSLKIRHNPQLRDLDALGNLESVGGDLQLVTLPELDDIDGLDALQNLGGALHIVDVDISHCRALSLAEGLDLQDADRLELIGLSGGTDCTSTDDRRQASGVDEAPIDRLPELDEMRRGELLEGVHPELVDRLRLMYALLEYEGIQITFISGYRPHETFYDAANRHASWHNLGLAVDLNLTHRDTLEEARNHYRGEDADKWQRIGEIANGLGIIWGEWFDDIFHFEWHPDYHARIRDHEMQQFQNLAGDDLDDYTAVWSLFEDGDAEDDADNCSGGCHVIPDDGLRQLLDALR